MGLSRPKGKEVRGREGRDREEEGKGKRKTAPQRFLSGLVTGSNCGCN